MCLTRSSINVMPEEGVTRPSCSGQPGDGVPASRLVPQRSCCSRRLGSNSHRTLLPLEILSLCLGTRPCCKSPAFPFHAPDRGSNDSREGQGALQVILTSREGVYALMWRQTPAKGVSFCVWPREAQSRREVQSASRELGLS